MLGEMPRNNFKKRYLKLIKVLFSGIKFKKVEYIQNGTV